MQQRETTALPLLVLSTAQRPLRRIAIDKPRISIGRRPYNDVMLDDLTVSGEHAVLHTGSGETVIHDLKSRNGTLVNGTPILQRVLADGDRIEIGIYRLQYVLERVGAEAGAGEPGARLRVLSGPRGGTMMPLERPITSIDNGSGQVAVIAQRRTGWHVTHLEGPTYPLVNGESIGLVAHPLRDEDLIELAGTIFQFLREPPS
ncbi:MAG TPA: FHA domain-containing protein [Burkholderiaceae bacterium]|nr:FHA domain-containing protein [Burkholderiaceae bacterium]